MLETRSGIEAGDTGLAGYLTGIGVNRIFLCGLAFDYCVFHSAMDGMKKGFETVVIPEFCRYIAEDSARNAEKEMTEAGILLLPPPAGILRSRPSSFSATVFCAV